MWKKSDDWFWEGNVQEKLAKHFENQGYKVTVANTLAKSRGIDILAQKDTDEILIEVKGYPSDKYVDGINQGQTKKTQSILQAHHWFSDDFFSVVRRKYKSQKSSVAIGLPESPRYLRLIEEAKWALEKLRIRIFIVTSTGEVYEI